ncbi:MAG: hypothetical protein WCP20_04825 [Desulfuromonadales bacterium]
MATHNALEKGSVGYNTIQLLKNTEFAHLTASELAMKQTEIHGQSTTSACIQWYINFCNQKKAEAEAENNVELVREYTIAPRQRKIARVS